MCHYTPGDYITNQMSQSYDWCSRINNPRRRDSITLTLKSKRREYSDNNLLYHFWSDSGHGSRAINLMVYNSSLKSLCSLIFWTCMELFNNVSISLTVTVKFLATIAGNIPILLTAVSLYSSFVSILSLSSISNIDNLICLLRFTYYKLGSHSLFFT